jgi:hypothetical protein
MPLTPTVAIIGRPNVGKSTRSTVSWGAARRPTGEDPGRGSGAQQGGVSGLAVTDGLAGVEEALAVGYPKTTLQTCIVHLIRNSLSYAGW